MNLKQFKEIESKGLIRTENRRISNITLRGHGHWKCLECLVEFEPLSNVPGWHNEIKIPINRIDDLVSIFHADEYPEYESAWNLSDFNGKYVRLCWYVTPQEEMHELADEETLYAIKHIVNDDDISTFIVDLDKKRK